MAKLGFGWSPAELNPSEGACNIFFLKTRSLIAMTQNIKINKMKYLGSVENVSRSSGDC